ncbi:MAG: SGNH/GDSL hydrolase family protein [Pseudomonadota bacterium]
MPTQKAWNTGPIHLDMRLKTDEFDTHIRTNSQGLRENERIDKKDKNTFRIVVIGDSFTFGWGVNFEETYVQVLEKELKQKVSKHIEVINFGRPGASATTYLRFMKSYVKSLEPDMVVIGFLLGNDSFPGNPKTWNKDPDKAYRQAKNILDRQLNNASAPREIKFSALYEQLIEPFLEPKFWNRVFHRYRGNCYLGVWNFDTVTREQIYSKYRAESSELQRYDMLLKDGWITKAKVCRIMPYRINSAIQMPLYWKTVVGLDQTSKDVVLRLWDFSHQRLYTINELGTSWGIPVEVMSFPSAPSVSKGAFNFMKKLGVSVSDEMLLDRLVEDTLLAFCDDHKLSCHPLLNPIRQMNSKNDDLFFHHDFHMNAKGNRVLGGLMAEALSPKIQDLYKKVVSQKH